MFERIAGQMVHAVTYEQGADTVEAAEELAQDLPDSELIVLRDAGHVPTLSRPTAVADAIDDFAQQRT